jgi:hypothetical protein
MNRFLILGLTLFLAGCTHNGKCPFCKSSGTKEVLFNGTDLSKWQARADGSDAKWVIRDGYMEVNGTGDIVTKEKYKDFTLHVEFWCPDTGTATGQARGNSGVYLQDRYEIQVLDSYGINPIQKNDCGAVYDQTAPLVNACKPPEQWQTYDITFHAAQFDASGTRTAKAIVSVVQNGKLIQKNTEIDGPTGAGAAENADPGPIRLQDHHNPVRYRNIWIVAAVQK